MGWDGIKIKIVLVVKKLVDRRPNLPGIPHVGESPFPFVVRVRVPAQVPFEYEFVADLIVPRINAEFMVTKHMAPKGSINSEHLGQAR